MVAIVKSLYGFAVKVISLPGILGSSKMLTDLRPRITTPEIGL